MSNLRSIGLIASSVVIATGAVGAAIVSTASGGLQQSTASENTAEPRYRIDTVTMPWGELRIDTVQLDLSSNMPQISSWRSEAEQMAHLDSANRYKSLTEADYRIVAAELGVETATIKAVVRIEAGAALNGFWAPGVPVINFDRSMYRRMKPATSRKASASMTVPAGISNNYGKREWSQLIAARKVNEDKANMGTFWGMFQIGGFNYKLCGCSDVNEFVERMSYSEFEQLELFAIFIRNSGMLPYLKEKNWAGFARKYNGASYARRGYHTKMAKAYVRFKEEEASAGSSTQK